LIRGVLFLFFFILTHASLILLYPFSLNAFLLCFSIYSAGTIIMLYILFSPRNRILVPNRSRVDSSKNCSIALTFDDGPSREHTPELLRILNEKNVKATFFVVGNRAEKNPEHLLRIFKQGHAVANHTYSHFKLFCFVTPWRLRKEIERCSRVIKKITAREPVFFRSPAGIRHPFLAYYLKKMGLEFISWRRRAFDTFHQEPDRIKEKLLGKIHPGDIILLHDGNKPEVKNMLSMLPQLIDELRDRGYHFVKL